MRRKRYRIYIKLRKGVLLWKDFFSSVTRAQHHLLHRWWAPRESWVCLGSSHPLLCPSRLLSTQTLTHHSSALEPSMISFQGKILILQQAGSPSPSDPTLVFQPLVTSLTHGHATKYTRPSCLCTCCPHHVCLFALHDLLISPSPHPVLYVCLAQHLFDSQETPVNTS